MRNALQLTRTDYYRFFAIYPILLVVMAAAAMALDAPAGRRTWAVACAAGALSWTLLEYLLHRFVLHLDNAFGAMHGAHHDAPRALIGTPTWMSLGVVALTVFLPALLTSSLNLASGLATGVMAGYFWYSLVHHTIHFRRPRPLAARLQGLSRHHFVHHYSPQPGNFGVTTTLWDRVFRTMVAAPVPGGGRKA